jgi:hypothetical protein
LYLAQQTLLLPEIKKKNVNLLTLQPNTAAKHYEDPVENGFLSNKVQIFGPQVSPKWTKHSF